MVPETEYNLGHPRGRRREGDDGHGVTWFRPHGVEVAEGVTRGYLPEEEKVIDDLFEKIDGVNLQPAIGRARDGGVVPVA